MIAVQPIWLERQKTALQFIHKKDKDANQPRDVVDTGRHIYLPKSVKVERIRKSTNSLNWKP